MNVTKVQELVDQQKQINTELNALKEELGKHEQAIEALYVKGEPIAEEGRRVARELSIELGLIDAQSDPQAA